MAVGEQRFPSPLRYPGGKGKVANYIKLVMLDNDLVGCDYVEPYAGGASVALSLLFEEYADHVHINDINRGVFAFWDLAVSDPDTLCDRILKAPLTVKEWRRQRAVQNDANADPIDLAFSTFFLNRTSRSGIIGGGVIGGIAQDGGWKIDARFNRKQLVQRLQKIGRFASRITVTRRDAAEFLQHELRTISRPFVYLDPPYFVKGQKGTRLYEDYYSADDHAAVAAVVRKLKAPWIVSYDAAPEVATLYGGFETITYNLTYSASAHSASGDEFMFFSRGLSRPSVDSPAGVASRIVGNTRLRVASA